MMRRLGCSIAVTVCLAAPGPALAQAPPDPYSEIPIETLYEEAANEMDGGNFASACPKLESVVRMAPEGIGARMTLAECYEGWGKLASAWEQYVAAEAMATKVNQEERAKKSGAKATELKPRLATLTIHVPEALKNTVGLTIMRDGAVMNDAQFGVAVPVDRGTHSIVVSATGKPPWKADVNVTGDGAQAKVDARLGEEPPKAPPAPTAPPPPPTAPAPSPAAETPAGAWRMPVTLTAIGLGLLGIGVGLELRNQAKDSFDASNLGHCDQNDMCDAAGVDLRNDALAKGNGATAVMIIGGSLAAAGIVMTLITQPELRPQKTISVALTASGLLLKGSW